jgi:Protein of unknown function (DUF3822)
LPAENHTVNPSFNITSKNTPPAKQNLFVQAGRQGISFVQLDSDSNTFTSVLVYHFAKHLADTKIAEAIKDIVSVEKFHLQHFRKIYVTWCFDENILVPQQYFDATNANEMLQLVYGDVMPGTVQNELVTTHNLYTVYKIPAAVKALFNNWVSFCIQSHESSLLINFDKATKDLLYCNFYPGHLTVMLRRSGKLQVIKNFEFSTPDDAVYHLLNVCQSFEVDATKIALTIGGMVDTNSNLYNELYKYFLKIDFTTLPENFNYTEEIKNSPAHYFSHLFVTAACVL